MQNSTTMITDLRYTHNFKLTNLGFMNIFHLPLNQCSCKFLLCWTRAEDTDQLLQEIYFEWWPSECARHFFQHFYIIIQCVCNERNRHEGGM